MTISQSIDNLIATRAVFRRYKVGRVCMSRRGYARKIIELLRTHGTIRNTQLKEYFGTGSVNTVLTSMASHGVLIRTRIKVPLKTARGTVKNTTGIEWSLAPNAEDRLRVAMAYPWF